MTEHLLGLLRVRVIRGINLAIRDIRSSDPYCILKMGKQEVFDKDLFTFDDAMGYAEFEIRPYVEAVKMNLNGVPNKTTIKKLIPNRQNCLAEESIIYCKDGRVIQDMALRLKKVECGEVEIQLHWVNIPGRLARYQDS